MKFSLNKDKYSGGGLYLVNTALVLSALTQSGIAHDKYLSGQSVLNLYNQLSWRIIANNTIVDADEGSWITDEYYSESIRNVIGKAIADCITGKNEFAGKTSIEDTITFDVDPRENKYTEANWNAVALWNLIHVYNCGFKDNENYTIDEAFKKVEENIKNTYSAQIADFDKILEKAMGDIKEYAKELNLVTTLKEFCKIAEKTKGKSAFGIKEACSKDNILVPNLYVGDYPLVMQECESSINFLDIFDSFKMYRERSMGIPIKLKIDNEKYFANSYWIDVLKDKDEMLRYEISIGDITSREILNEYPQEMQDNYKIIDTNPELYNRILNKISKLFGKIHKIEECEKYKYSIREINYVNFVYDLADLVS